MAISTSAIARFWQISDKALQRSSRFSWDGTTVRSFLVLLRALRVVFFSAVPLSFSLPVLSQRKMMGHFLALTMLFFYSLSLAEALRCKALPSSSEVWQCGIHCTFYLPHRVILFPCCTSFLLFLCLGVIFRARKMILDLVFSQKYTK